MIYKKHRRKKTATNQERRSNKVLEGTKSWGKQGPSPNVRSHVLSNVKFSLSNPNPKNTRRGHRPYVDNGIHKCIKIHLVWFVYKLVDGLWGELRGSAIDRSATCKATKKIIMEHITTANNMKKYAWANYPTWLVRRNPQDENKLMFWVHGLTERVIL